jgi:drug/metabolite transporter (DMT)-like permease
MRLLMIRPLLLLSLLTAILFPVFSTQPAAALIGGQASKSAACAGLQLDNGTNVCASEGTSGLNSLITTIINILSIIIGVAAVIMIIIGGFRYVTSGGDSNSTSAAKSTIIYALVGLVVAVLAQVLVQFVLDKTACPSGSKASECVSAK